MTTERKIKNIFTYLTPSFVSNMLPFLTLPIITRFLTPKDFGVVSLALGFPILIANILSLNVQVGAERYYFEYRKDFLALRSLINSTVYFMLFVFIFALPAIYFFKNILSTIVMGAADYSKGIVFAYLAACLGVFIGFYRNLYRNMERSKLFAFFTVMQMLIYTIFSLVLLVGFQAGYMSLIYATFFSRLIIFFVLFRMFQKEFPYCFDSKILIDNLKYGIPLLPNNFLGSIHAFFDKFMLRSFLSLSTAGIYSIAQNISKKMFVFMTAIQSTFFPIFMKDVFDKGRAAATSVGRNFTIFSYISLFPILILILFGEELIFILAPSSYHSAINVMLILLCAMSTQTFGKIVGIQLAYVKKAYLAFPISGLSLFVNIGLNIVLIPIWGALGAGIATLFSVLLTNFSLLAIAQRYYKINFDIRNLLLLYLTVFLSAALLVFCRVVDVFIVSKYFIKIFSLVLFILLGIRTNIINKKNFMIALNIFTLNKVPVGA